MALDLIIVPDFPELARVAELIRQDLARVGIEVEIRVDPENVPVAADPANGIDRLPLGWAMDFPDPANAVTEPLVAGADIWPLPKGTAEPPWYRAALAAQSVTGPARARTFRALDRRLSRVDVPATVYAAQLGRPVFFADRVGCQRLLPLFEGLPDLTALCLRGKS